VRQLIGSPSIDIVPAVKTSTSGTWARSAAPAITERVALPVQRTRIVAVMGQVVVLQCAAVASWFREEIILSDRLALFLTFVAFITTFLATRAITRMIRAGRGPFKDNLSAGGLHVHHAVPGLILLVVGAFMSVGTGSVSPFAEIAAVLVGIGTSLVLDEFALILHLQDVYWAQEGRVSVEMITLAVGATGLALVGVNPFDFSGEAGDTAKIALSALGLVCHLALVVVCVLKGKYPTALFGTFIPFVSWIGAWRLARPSSRWARRFYPPQKLAKATARAAKHDDRWGPITGRISDFIAGSVSEPNPPPVQDPTVAAVRTSELDADYAAAWAESTAVRGIGAVPTV
jgi:hypothetical protein